MTVLAPGCGPNAPIVVGSNARAATATRSSGAGTLHSFTLHNTSGSAATAAMARLGLAFTKGDVSARQRLAVRVQGGQPVVFAAAAATNSWADGSLRSTADAGLVMVDSSPIAAGKSRTYEVYAVAGSPAKSGFDPWAWLAGHGNDLTVAVTARTGSATGPKPDLLFSLKTAIQTTTRREILCDTSRFVRVKVWQKAPQEEHLICEYHLDFWLDAGAQPISLEFAPVLTQHWWVADPFGTTQTKERYTYDAVVTYGTTVLDNRGRLDHAYYCRWASLRPQDDAQHARKHWIGLGLSQMPTTRIQYDEVSLKRMMRAGYIPPFRLGVNYVSDTYTPATTYVPLAANGHRAYIPGTGAYPGRGVWTDPDAKLVCRQAQLAAIAEKAWRTSRVMAQAGMSVYIHVRDHRSPTRLNGNVNPSNRLIPLPFKQSSQLDTQYYPDLAPPTIYARGTIQADASSPVLLQSIPVGGTGAMRDYDDQHAQNYSAPTSFLEGEAYLGDAAISQLIGQSTFSNWNGYGHDATLAYATTPRRNAMNIPYGSANQYGAVIRTGYERGLAWGINIMNAAFMIRADNHPEFPWLKNYVRNASAWAARSLDYYPVAHLTRGPFVPKYDAQGAHSPWMTHWQGMAFSHSARLCDFAATDANGLNGFQRAAELGARYITGVMSSAPYASGAYVMIWNTDGSAFLSPVPQNEWPWMMEATFSGSIGTLNRPPNNELPVSLPLQNGDKIRVITWNANTGAQTVPTGIHPGALYYTTNVVGNTFQLSSSQGGSPITISDQTNVGIGITMQSFSQQSSLISPLPGDDTYTVIAMAMFEQALGNSFQGISAEIRDATRAWFAPKISTFSNYASWNYNGDNLN